jgi:hypothetical protein
MWIAAVGIEVLLRVPLKVRSGSDLRLVGRPRQRRNCTRKPQVEERSWNAAGFHPTCSGLFESGCCDVVYVLPGRHQIFVQFGITGRLASATLTGNLAAGRVYEAEAIVVSGDKVAFRLRERPPGYVLTYKDLRPNLYPPHGSWVNSRVVPKTE